MPLRTAAGFTIVGAWTVPAINEFVWILEHADFVRADRTYYESDERKNASPDPALLIETGVEEFAHRVI